MPKLSVSQQGVSLKAILPEGRFVGADDIWIRSCCGKWDECQEGDLFVALIDADTDGHLFVQDAANSGAQSILGERLTTSSLPQCIVPDSRQAYARICQALAGKPSSYLATVGITGSHGKTSVSYLVDSILSSAALRVGRFDSDLCAVSGRSLSQTETTWTPPQIAFTMARFVLEDCSHAVIEAPSEFLATHNFAGLELDVAVLTNIRRQHLDLHLSVENYRRVKARLLGLLKLKGVAVINADDPVCHYLIDEIKAPTLTYAIHQDANVKGRLLESAWGEQTFLISAGTESVVIRSSIIGKQHVYNCLAATATCLSLGLDLTSIAKGIENCQLIPGRMQTINCGQSFGVLVDSAENSEQLATVLNTVKYAATGRVFCVCSYDENQSAQQRYHLGRIAERHSHMAVITGPSPVSELDYEPSHQILDGFKNVCRAQVIPDRIKAIEWALGQAKPGDVVVVTGRGSRAIATVDQSRWAVTDAEVCKAWLYENVQEEAPIVVPGNDIFNIDDYRN